MSGLRFVMIGGFLGSGKTTTIARLADAYQAQGLKVGIVTNDQAADLVDTHSLRSQGRLVGEVAGSCFCCNFNALLETVGSLEAAAQPDVILAEPVGSCTDLVATVAQPLMQLYGGRFDVAPYGVILKPSHGRRILRGGLASGDKASGGGASAAAGSAASGGAASGGAAQGVASSGFSSKAAYIFRKQLEEADFLIINRIDELQRSEVEELAELLNKECPGLPQLRVSAKTGEGFDGLLQMLDQRGGFGRRVLDLDYDIYAEGEAELGWLNSSLTVHSTSGRKFALDALLLGVVERLKAALAVEGAEPAHLKTIGLWEGFYGVANLVSGDTPAELSLPSSCEVSQAEVVVNARVAVDPETLARLVTQTVEGVCGSMGLNARWRETRSFRPGRPVPTHRLAAPTS